MAECKRSLQKDMARLIEISLGLPRKANHDIGSNAKIRDDGSCLVQKLKELLHLISTAHGSENAIASATAATPAQH